MIASIGKFSKSFLAKVLVVIIALPFILWGMGDVFRSGNQNVIAEINDTKVTTKEFMEYLQAINITQDDIKKRGKEKLINEVLTNYISEKIISIETKEKGIQLTDLSLKEILTSDKDFRKDGKFLRTKYEKFLLTNRLIAADYEKNIFNLETKGQLLSFYSGGIKLPKFLIDDFYKQENKSKQISYIDLEKVYSQKKVSESDIKDFYEKNKEFFKDKFIKFRYLKLSPEILLGKSEFDETYFKKIEVIENDILDGKNFDDITSFSKINIEQVDYVNSKKFKKDGNIFKINQNLLNEVFKIQKLNVPIFVSFNNEFYVAELLSSDNSILGINNKNVRETINNQVKLINLIERNSSLAKKIIDKKFGDSEMLQFSKKYNVPIQKAEIKNIKDDSQFNNALLKQIYNYTSGQIFVVTDYPVAKKNFLIKINNEEDPVINPNSEIYKGYLKKTNANYISKVYKSYDSYINSIYKININEKVLERLVSSI
tara:strand:+ start:1219 stop:2673 length:1455 start_codon:yes stop_codon:yes gene_type:complete